MTRCCDGMDPPLYCRGERLWWRSDSIQVSKEESSDWRKKIDRRSSSLVGIMNLPVTSYPRHAIYNDIHICLSPIYTSSLTKNRSATTTFLSIDSRVYTQLRNGVAPAETTDMTCIPLNIVGCSNMLPTTCNDVTVSAYNLNLPVMCIDAF